ncbi:MAG: GGDEF domain-containing protein [Solirubrobacterales bacterium]
MLEQVGLAGREAELRDEESWFADHRRTDLFEAAAEVLGEPRVARNVGRSALEHSLGTGLKLSLRALGSPRLVYSNIARANAKFTTAYEMSTLHTSDRSATLRNVRKIDGPMHPSDCEYNVGLLSTVPAIFGLPPARVRHSSCVFDGGSECRYEISWQEERATVRWAVAGIGILGGTALLAPTALPLGAGAAALAAAMAGREMVIRRFGKIRHLDQRLEEETEAAALITTSLRELVAELKIDDLLERIPRYAHAAAGGAEFALLVGDDGRTRCRGATGLTAQQIDDLERWAAGLGADSTETVTIDELSSRAGLEAVASGGEAFGSLCAAPLRSHGTMFGFLVALFTGERGVLPRDIDQLESYAALAAIARQNATLYETQRDLATRDPLTGLLNHSQLHELLEAEIARADRSEGEVGVALFDLDHFKQVNDTFGHACGDEVLRGVGAALRGSVRGFDQVFRIGGDEFAMIVAGGGVAETTGAAERAKGAIDRTDPRASAAYGVAAWPTSGGEREAVLAAADASLYAQKRAGRPGHAPAGVSEVVGGRAIGRQ